VIYTHLVIRIGGRDGLFRVLKTNAENKMFEAELLLGKHFRGHVVGCDACDRNLSVLIAICFISDSGFWC